MRVDEAGAGGSAGDGAGDGAGDADRRDGDKGGSDVGSSSIQNGLTIRLATEHELPRVVEIVNNAFDAAYEHVRSPRSVLSTSIPPPLPPATAPLTPTPTRTTLAKVHDCMQQHGCIAFVCVESITVGNMVDGFRSEQQILGTVLTPSHHLDFESAGRADTESFGSLAVDPARQGRGIGTVLFFFYRNVHPRMPLVHTPARLTLLHVRDQWNCSRVSTSNRLTL
jgi:ribosomal protein S18 acetylase RimI-like enzyme